jgi:PTS system galactitol-specific IIB component
MEERGLKVTTVQARVPEVPSMIEGACAVVATAEVPFELNVPVINGLPFLTGAGLEEVLDQIEQIVRDNQGEE